MRKLSCKSVRGEGIANCVAHTSSLPLSVLLKQHWTFPCKAALNETVSRWPSSLISANYTAAVNYSDYIAASLFLPLCSSGQVSGVSQTSHLSHTSHGSRMVICRGDGVPWKKNEASCSLKNRMDTWQCFIKLVVWGRRKQWSVKGFVLCCNGTCRHELELACASLWGISVHEA